MWIVDTLHETVCRLSILKICFISIMQPYEYKWLLSYELYYKWNVHCTVLVWLWQSIPLLRQKEENNNKIKYEKKKKTIWTNVSIVLWKYFGIRYVKFKRIQDSGTWIATISTTHPTAAIKWVWVWILRCGCIQQMRKFVYFEFVCQFANTALANRTHQIQTKKTLSVEPDLNSYLSLFFWYFGYE